MLDLGGMSSSGGSKSIKRMDASKNCKLRAIAFDFDLLTRSVENKQQPTIQQKDEEEKTTISMQKDESLVSNMSGVMQEMATLLKVKLGGERTPHKAVAQQDDLSGLLGDDDVANKESPLRKDKVISGQSTSYSSDIRAKYAAKLKNKGEGLGVGGIDRAKQEIEETLTKGDAAGHLAARAMLSQQSAGETKWMALTGTGNLLNYISNRTMKVALVPLPKDERSAVIKSRMEEFAKQLPHVSFDLMISKGDEAGEILQQVQAAFKLDPVVTMVVSDRDDYLRAARDAGWITCRIQPKNGRRGNISAHYSSETVAGVKDVVDHINGISYQAVFAALSQQAAIARLFACCRCRAPWLWTR
jgi:hypothetical protein